jgi:DNA-binding transcriptional MerR regulator
MTVTAVAGAVLLIAALLLLGGRLLRHRNRPSAQDQHAALRLIPIPAATQQAVADLLRQDRERQALTLLRRETDVPLGQVHQLMQIVAEHPHPRTYQESLAVLREQHPDLEARLHQLIQQRSPAEAIRHLRRQLPLGLIAAQQLIAAQRKGESR